MSDLASLPEQLFGPFAAIHDEHPDCHISPYYEGVFFEYARDAPATQTWDLAVYDSVVAATGARRILDLGCGAGRITSHLAKRQDVERVAGLDNSLAAAEAFHQMLGAHEKISFIHSDIAYPEGNADFDLAILGNLNINCFLNPEEVKAAFRGVKTHLAAGGQLLVLVFTPEVAETFPTAGMDAVAFTDAQNCTRLIWRAMQFDPATSILQRNYFIEGRDGERIIFPGVLGVCRERIWTVSEILQLADDTDYRCVDSTTHCLEGGNADGWTCQAVLLLPNTENS